MHRIFLPIYRYLKSHRTLMYLLMTGSFLLFVCFAVRIRLEEDIIKLLPREATQNELAFSDIELKNKSIIQVTSRDAENPVAPEDLAAGMDGFCRSLEAADSSGRYIKGILDKLDISLALDAMDFGIAHLPSFVDTSYYASILSSLEPSAIDSMMAVNYAMVMDDFTGDATMLASMDPLGIRNVVMAKLLPEDGNLSMGGFALVDGHLFCPDKTVALAFLTPSFDPMNSGTSTRFVSLINREKAAFESAHPDMRVLMHGDVMGSVSNASTMKKDLLLTVGISLLLILTIILLSFHRFSFVLQQIGPVVYGTAFSLACMYWIKGYMSLMALGVSALVLGVAVSYCLHILIHYYYVADTETMLREESTPVFLGCLTTVGAFLGLLFTESDLLRDFGLFSTFALIGSTLFALVFLPHFLRPTQIVYRRSHGFPLVEKVNSLPWDRSPWIIGPLLVLIAVGIAFSPRVKFDSDLRNLDYDSPALTESQDLYNRKNADGAMHLYFATHNDTLDTVLSYNDALFAALDSLSQAGLVKSYSPVARLLLVSEKDQRERIAAWEEFWNAERVAKLRKDLSASAVKNGLPAGFAEPFIALVQASYEPGNLYESGIMPPSLMSNYVEHQSSGRYMVFTDVAFAQEDKDIVTDALVEDPGVLVVEPFYYCRSMVEIVHHDFRTTLLISSIFVLLVLLLSFRNIWISIIAFLPMFTSWYVLQGYMAIFGLEFNLINIVISTFIFGIGVDYSIFVMEGLLTQAREGKDGMLAYHKVAIVYSAMVLAIVTFSLIFATHPAVRSIGLITLIGMASTILITYSLQPFVFRLLAGIPYFRRSFRIPEK